MTSYLKIFLSGITIVLAKLTPRTDICCKSVTSAIFERYSDECTLFLSDSAAVVLYLRFVRGSWVWLSAVGPADPRAGCHLTAAGRTLLTRSSKSLKKRLESRLERGRCLMD